MQFIAEDDVFGVLFQYPDGDGVCQDLSEVISAAHATHAQVVVAADIMSLAILKSPGSMGARHRCWQTNPAIWCSDGIWGASCSIFRCEKKSTSDIFQAES